MGLATAKIVGRDHTVVLCDVRQDRLDAAVSTLDGLGITCKAVNCDVTDRQAVDGLLETAAGLGPIASVIHTAGVSPSMGPADYVMRTNAIGTVNVNEAFYQIAGEGSAIVNVASMAAHMLPENMVPTEQFPQALEDEDSLHDGHDGGLQRRARGDAVRHRLRREQELRQVVLHVAVRKVRRPGSAHRFGLAWVHRHRDGQAGGGGRGRRDGRRRRGPAMGQAGGDGGAAGVLRQRQGRLPHRHRHPERRRSGRLDDRASQGGCRQAASRQSTSTQRTMAAVAVASTVSRIVSLCRSSVASVFSNRSSRAIRNNGNATLIAMSNPPRM